jgi:uncharacterized phage-associated protein
MRLQFNEAKAAQAAARLLKLRGGQMSYLKLIKLLYFVDREALLRWGRPVTTDRYVSMDNGPVVSKICNLIREEPRPGTPTVWYSLISRPENYEVSLLQDPPPDDELSIIEERLIDEMFMRFGSKSRWELVDLSHRLPEWKDPQGSAIPFNYADILRAENKSEQEITETVQELEEIGAVEVFTFRRA